MKKKLITFIIIIGLIATTSVLGYWAYNLLGDQETEDNTVTIGEGEEVQTTLNVTSTENNDILVPDGYGTFQSSFEFDILWDAPSGATGDLIVTIDSIELGDLTEAEILTMFELTYEDISLNANELTTYEILIDFANEPLDHEMYQQVANQDLIIIVTFEIIPSEN